MRGFRWVTLLALIFALVAPSTGGARRADTHAYRMEQVWSTVVRLLRVDYRYNLRDRDREIGYILFDYPNGTRTVPGSLELVGVETRGQTHVRVTINIPAMPAYVERMHLDRLTRKLVEDHGAPMPPPPRRRPEPIEDDEDEDDESEDESSD